MIAGLGNHSLFGQVFVHGTAMLPRRAMVVAENRKRELNLTPSWWPRNGSWTRVAPTGHQQTSITQLNAMSWSRCHVFPAGILGLRGDFQRRGPAHTIVSAVGDKNLLVVFAKDQPENSRLPIVD